MTRPQPQSQPRSATTATGPRKKRALIIGAGPVGSLTALSLDKRGWEVEVWEGRTGESEYFCFFFLSLPRGESGGYGGLATVFRPRFPLQRIEFELEIIRTLF
jgi:glycine/D-amino acid oxidase-like deaminating enzyme